MSKRKVRRKTRKLYRDAKTGQFVTEDVVKRRPATTVTETIPIPTPKSKKRKK